MSDMMQTLARIKAQTSTHDCPRCEGPAYCAMEAGKSSNLCWCMAVERTHNPDSELDQCLCRHCLADA